MNYWLTTDTHFNHANIKSFENRPDNFEEVIIKHHSEVIQPEDVLIHLGDTIFANKNQLKEYLSQINCRSKVLVRGNHDEHFTDTWLMNNGFNFVCDSLTINFVLLSHAPMKLTDDIRLNIHGHMHSGKHRQDELWYPYYSERHLLLGLENTNYYPVKLADVISGKCVKDGYIRR